MSITGYYSDNNMCCVVAQYMQFSNKNKLKPGYIKV